MTNGDGQQSAVIFIKKKTPSNVNEQNFEQQLKDANKVALRTEQDK